MSRVARECVGGGGAHAVAPCGRSSRWVSLVSSRNRSSRPPSAERRSVRTIECSAATRPTSTGAESTRRPVPAASDGHPLGPQALGERVVVERGHVRDRVLGVGEQLLLVALGDDPAMADQDHLVGDQLDLVEQVAGQQHRAAAVGVALEQPAHPADTGRVEAVGGLVQDEHRGVSQERVRDAEPLLHAERVVAQPALGLGLRQRDQLEHLVDPGRRQAHGLGAEGQDLATGASGVLSGRVEQDADVATWVRDVLVEVPSDGDPTTGGGGQTHHDPHGGGLPGAVGAEEAGHPAGLGHEADVVDGREGAVLPRESLDGDHGPSLPHAGWAAIVRGARHAQPK